MMGQLQLCWKCKIYKFIQLFVYFFFTIFFKYYIIIVIGGVLNMLRKFLRKIFRKKDIKNNVLANITDIIPMPTKEEFLEDELSLSLIEEYKREYLKKLKTKRTISSIDVNSNNNQDIYIDILMNLCGINNCDVSFRDINSLPNEKLNLSIKVLKLKYYLEDIGNIIRDTKLHVIALNEILEEEFLSKNKRNAIINEINNLLHSLLQLKNQEIASIKEVFNYLKDIDTVKLKEVLENNKLDITKDEIENRLSEVAEMASLVIPEKLNTHKKLYLDSLELIAKLEQELEIYVYLNKSIINDLKSKVIKEDEIKELELLFKIFTVYGRNLVTKEDLRKVYEVKFRVITKDIFKDINFKIPENLSFTELECYQDIIFKKINRLRNRDYVKNIVKMENAKAEISIYVKEILKNDNEFLWYEVLNDRIMLAFILAFDYENNLDKFFNELMVKKCDYPEIYFYDRYTNEDMCFKWDSIIPLGSVLEILEFNIRESVNRGDYNIIRFGINSDSSFKIYYFHRLYKIYELYKKHYGGIYKLPEGITYINWDEAPEKLKKIIENKFIARFILCTPSTLKVMLGNISEYIYKLILNDGLEILRVKMLYPCSEISLPGALKVLSWDCFNFEKLRELEIRDYEDSIILNDYIILREFVKNIYRSYRDTYKPFLLENKEIGGHVNSKFIPSLTELVLHSKDGSLIKLNKEDLTYPQVSFKEKPTTTKGPYKLTDEEVEKVMGYLKRVIELKKTKALKRGLNK